MRLVPEYTGWGDLWRWYSLRFTGMALALQGAWQAIPDDLKATVPDWTLQVLTAILVLAGFLGRLIDQNPENPDA